MKKILLFVFSLFMVMGAFAGSQGEDNGLDLKLQVGFHNKKYGFSDVDLSKLGFLKSDYPFKNATPTIGFTLDSRWYLGNPGSFGIGINARWVDFAFANCVSRLHLEYEVKTNVSSVSMILPYTATTKTQFYDLNICGVGPIVTYYFNYKTAVDMYYIVMPNLFLRSMKKPELSSDSDLFKDYYMKLLEQQNDDRANLFALGASHRIGGVFRHKVIEVGVEAKFGKLTSMSWGKSKGSAVDVVDQMIDDLSDGKIKAGSFRVFMGFKFR